MKPGKEDYLETIVVCSIYEAFSLHLVCSDNPEFEIATGTGEI